jgi:hypothetical protein
MKLKLVAVIVYLLLALTPMALVAESVPQQRDCDKAAKCNDPANHVIRLDQKGMRGGVCFAHKTHEPYLNPDPDFAHQTEKGAECVGCHHRRVEGSDAPTLWKCDSCHRSEGTPSNPHNREGDEVYNERAFHELCIGCHKASNTRGISKCKAPVACSECHESVAMK